MFNNFEHFAYKTFKLHACIFQTVNTAMLEASEANCKNMDLACEVSQFHLALRIKTKTGGKCN